MPDSFHIAEDFQAPLAALPQTLEDAMAGLGIDLGACRRRSTIRRRKLPVAGGGVVDVYTKVYSYRKHPWRRFLRPGRVGRERRGLERFRALGFRCPHVVAWGARRDLAGRLQLECIVTTAVSTAGTLEEWVLSQRDLPPRESRRRRRELSRALAAQVARLHASGYFHRDLRWRNVMIHDDGGIAEPVWYDSPRGQQVRLPWIRTRSRLRELARLNRGAQANCTLRERMEFLCWYLGARPGDPRLREWWRMVGSYSQRRWSAPRQPAAPPPGTPASGPQGR